MAEVSEDTGRYDVLTIGRVGVDVYPLQVGVPLDKVETFGKFLGGVDDQCRRRGGQARPAVGGHHAHRR